MPPASFPELTDVEGSLTVQGNAELTMASFPKLTDVGVQVYVTNNAELTIASFPKLTSAGTFAKAFNNHPDLGTCDSTALASVEAAVECLKGLSPAPAPSS